MAIFFLTGILSVVWTELHVQNLSYTVRMLHTCGKVRKDQRTGDLFFHTLIGNLCAPHNKYICRLITDRLDGRPLDFPDRLPMICRSICALRDTNLPILHFKRFFSLYSDPWAIALSAELDCERDLRWDFGHSLGAKRSRRPTFETYYTITFHPHHVTKYGHSCQQKSRQIYGWESYEPADSFKNCAMWWVQFPVVVLPENWGSMLVYEAPLKRSSIIHYRRRSGLVVITGVS